MKKSKKLAEFLFVVCLAAILALTGACEQGSISTTEYIVYSAIALVVLLWSGVKGQLLHKKEPSRLPPFRLSNKK